MDELHIKDIEHFRHEIKKLNQNVDEKYKELFLKLRFN